VIALDLCGVFVFAVTGALLAVREDLDVFGVMVIGFVSGLGGGVVRDLLLGAVPPPVSDWRYVVVGAGAGLLAFIFPLATSKLQRPFLVARVPALFRGEVYASAALAGASVVLAGNHFAIDRSFTVVAGCSRPRLRV
jgi:uncharacterized membrane protein YeiH